MSLIAVAILLGSAGFGAGYAFRDSGAGIDNGPLMRTLIAGQGAFLGLLAGAALTALALVGQSAL